MTLVAIAPPLLGFLWEHARKGKGRYVDPSTIFPGWTQLRQSMGIETSIQVKVFPHLRNAYADRITARVNIGQPVLDSLDIVSVEALVAHEFAHISGDSKQDYSLTRKCLLLAAAFGALLAAAILLCLVSYTSGPPGSSLFWLSVPLTAIASAGISVRFVSWPREYQADLTAMQYVNCGAVVSFLRAMAALRKIDVTRDFYTHPSIDRRIANLDWSQETRFREWHFGL